MARHPHRGQATAVPLLILRHAGALAAGLGALAALSWLLLSYPTLVFVAPFVALWAIGRFARR